MSPAGTLRVIDSVPAGGGRGWIALRAINSQQSTNQQINKLIHQKSVMHRDRPVAHAGQFIVVGYNHKRLVELGAKAKKQFVQFLFVMRIEVAGRLIGQHHIGIIDKGTGNGNPLLFAAGKSGRFMIHT